MRSLNLAAKMSTTPHEHATPDGLARHKWRTIPDFPNYVISDQGVIATKDGRRVVPPQEACPSKVSLMSGGVSRCRSIAKLMRAVWPDADEVPERPALPHRASRKRLLL